ncbi:MAG: type I-C CRISPR-associated protein Cas8c/Csd1, partial [Desulfovibrio sp.]|nr:type I-C CRISPR-associated protein Cas8c/Csd1 [Desulfovibrio sp.]
MRAILTGSAYPGGLLAAVIGRIRAEQKIGYIRAALIKACLIRNARLASSGGQTPEVTMSLDEQSTNPAYLLGRLFAVLEKVQQAAHSSTQLNSTIMDNYFSSASAMPRRVFPYLTNTLLPAHLRKLAADNRNLAYYFKNLVAKILDPIWASQGGYPAHLSIEDQGLFTLGYYHQFRAKKVAAPETTTPTED